MLQEEHSAILSTFIELPFVIKVFVFSIIEWLVYTGFTVDEGADNKDVTGGKGVRYASLEANLSLVGAF